jgi:hypothetical protein
MADEHNRTWPKVDRTCHGIDIVRECAEGIVHCHDAQRVGLQECNHFAPARRICPGAVDDHYGRGVVTRQVCARIRLTFSPDHLLFSLSASP